jgi:CelD/BcsL family acetyltransferase involved in cellulose biosynthesis
MSTSPVMATSSHHRRPAGRGSSVIVAGVAGRIEWVDDPAGLAALADDWEQLSSGHGSPFGDHAWFSAWWEAFGSGGLAVCALWEDGQLQAVLPLSAHGGRLAGLANYHTPLFTAPSRGPESLASVVEHALARATAVLTLAPVDAADPLRNTVVRAAESRGRLVLSEHLYRSPRVQISGDFATYGRQRGPRFKDLARRWRKLNREHETRFRVEAPSGDLEADLRKGYEVEASGWKGEQRTAILSTPETQSFYTAIARAYQARGQLRLIWLEIDGRPAAFSFCLLRGSRLYCLKTGIDDRLRPHSPGLLIDYCTIQHCFEAGLESYELLGAEEAYKEYFATARSEHLRLSAYGRRPTAVARYVTRRVGRPLVLAARRRRGG